jgi:hypothetical protein
MWERLKRATPRLFGFVEARRQAKAEKKRPEA